MCQVSMEILSQSWKGGLDDCTLHEAIPQEGVNLEYVSSLK